MNNANQTTWQRAVLVAMHGVASKSAEPSQVWFTRKAIEHLLWCDWHGYHTVKMESLIRSQWVEKATTSQGSKVYRLTSAAYVNISQDVALAVAECRMDVTSTGQMKLL